MGHDSADAEEKLDRFGCLKGAHDANNCSENTCLLTGRNGSRRRRLGNEAPVAGVTFAGKDG